MFDRLKKKMFGEEVFCAWVPSLVRIYVYIWERGGEFTLRISSDRGSYARGMAGNYTALWFEPSEVQGLLDAIATANDKMKHLAGKASQA